jgi:hypothetical protein
MCTCRRLVFAGVALGATLALSSIATAQEPQPAPDVTPKAEPQPAPGQPAPDVVPQTEPQPAPGVTRKLEPPAAPSLAEQGPVSPIDADGEEALRVRRLVEDEATHRDRLARIERLRELARETNRRERLAQLDDLERREVRAHEARRLRERNLLSDGARRDIDAFERRGGVLRIQDRTPFSDERRVQKIRRDRDESETARRSEAARRSSDTARRSADTSRRSAETARRSADGTRRSTRPDRPERSPRP